MTINRGGGGMAGGSRPSRSGPQSSQPLSGTPGSQTPATGSNDEAERRSRRLNTVFCKTLQGDIKINRATDARNFIESIAVQKDKTSCLERIASSQAGQDALHKALVFSDSADFMNTVVSGLLEYLDDPAIKRLCDGELLAQVLWVIVDPPVFWNNLLRNAKNGALNTKALEGFVWLLLQLIMLPSTMSDTFREAAEVWAQVELPPEATSPKVEALTKQIKALIRPSTAVEENLASFGNIGPGGRHDNDFVNFRDIAILPTRGELLSTERPFYLLASSITTSSPSDRPLLHLDNQFRMLREDMIGEMQEEFRNIDSTGRKKRGFRNTVIKNLSFVGYDQTAMKGGRSCTLVFECPDDILSSFLTIKGANTPESRKKALKKTQGFLRHQSFGCLVQGKNVLGFTAIDRNEDQLARSRPRIGLVITGSDSFQQTLAALRQGTVDYLQLSTPVFAYEPILERLQKKTDIELVDDLLSLSETPQLSNLVPQDLLDTLQQMTGASDLTQLLNLTKAVTLDPSQIKALVHGLMYQVSSIQGPPGTGKSLVGALIAKVLLDNTAEKFLVLSYTNHALDQFIEDLMDIGIDQNLIVRLGSKSTFRTASLLLSAQSDANTHRRRARFELISFQRDHLSKLVEEIEKLSDDYFREGTSPDHILEYLQYSPEESHFYDALSVPEAQDGETIVGAKGKKMRPDHLYRRWESGAKSGLPNTPQDPECADVWNMPRPERVAKIHQWETEISQEKLQRLTTLIKEFNKGQKTLQRLRQERTEHILQGKRIIACTTTAASMFASEIQSAQPGIIIVEEAGEILESHILAAMGPSTKQLIQIGDHKQLRPKAKNYKLSVEAGHGYDFNRSLFERLVIQNRPSCTLLNQHRMRPEISALIKHHYPSLNDAQGTENRPHLSGFQDDVIFVNHSNPEEKHNALVDTLDQTMKSSKQNIFEAEMVLKCVRYLGQHKYKTDDIVILTPYLGQLFMLREMLSQDHDPILNDLDSHDLVEAGVLPAASADVHKNPIRLSTIDNYQGEESNIVIVSLTRSNEDGEIGFMAAPERLNVLISRARNALIMIGNASTFMNATKGRDEWTRLFDNLKATGKIHDGFPVKCEKHPDRKMTLRSAAEFDLHCPDGGCAEPCSELLSCGKHVCPKRCHILDSLSHSKVPCSEAMKDQCTNGHPLVWRCSDIRPPACQTCRLEKEEKERKARRDKDLELERQAKQRAYAKELAAIKDAIEKKQQAIKDRKEEQMWAQTLHQHQTDLARVTQEAKRVTAEVFSPSPKNAAKSEPNPATAASSGDQNPTQPQEDKQISTPGAGQIAPEETGDKKTKNDDEPEVSTTGEANSSLGQRDSAAEKDWRQQKELHFSPNEALDSLMNMIGLEAVKQEFLNIKARVDTAVRQGVDLKGDRFGTALLGNPGTGKTTVARLYGKFLSSMGVIPGSHFEETTGSRLAHDGIQGAQALVDKLLQNGGGVFFLDEAYQIVSSSSLGGSQVLDFLLAEIENQTGKIVFVFAGYRKQMETFFAHNPGIPSRIPIQLDFDDYEDGELLRIMQHQLKQKFNGRMKVEGGEGGLYMRIAARRIGRGRGREGFGNAREVHNALSTILKKQADRLHKRRQSGGTPDDMLLRKIDIIGPEPNGVIASNGDWRKLQKLIGLKSVKNSIQTLVDRLQANYQRELNEQPLIEASLNKVFVGNPGTGKTTVAKLYGKILAAIGLLSNGEVVVKNPADFVGGHLGQSEKNTKAILEATKGKVLIIDEAYMLGSGLSDNGGVSDPYKTAVIDTIVAEVQSTSLEDRCVLLLGYQEQMEDMFQKVNPGLARRFPMSSAFVFEDYDDSELRSILDLKLKQQGFRAGEAAKKACISMLGRARNRKNFGNAGEVDIILDQAKERQQKRLSESNGSEKVDFFEPQDIDPEYNRLEHATTNIRMLFKDVVGCEDVIERLEGYQKQIQNMKGSEFSDEEIRSYIPFSVLFRGPPGTGKTSTARRMGKVYYDLGLLSDAKVVECSATDLIGQYVGQTGPKVQRKFDEALGRVLFIDEAYRLAEGHFAKEAMDEMVDCLTKTRYLNKILVILAGYDDDINRLMNQNPGLTSRFPETMSFHNMPPTHCRDLLLKSLSRKFDIAQLEASPTLDGKLLNLFGILAKTTSWGNARDVETIAKSIGRKTLMTKKAGSSQVVDENTVTDAINSMIKERSSRVTTARSEVLNPISPPIQLQDRSREPSCPKVSTTADVTAAPEKEEKEEFVPPEDEPEQSGPKQAACRDAGVSDEVWEQLQRDKEVAEHRERGLMDARRKAEELKKQILAKEKELERQRDEAARLEALRQLELVRLEQEQVERKRVEMEIQKRKHAAARAKLKRAGLCPAEYEWIQQSSGYRCAGGSHFIGNGDLDRL